MGTDAILYKLQNYCPKCNSIVETGVLYNYTYDVTYTDELQNQGNTIMLSKCLNCDSPFLVEEEFQNIEEHSWTNSSHQLYPIEDNLALKHAPQIVIQPYKEAHKCFRAQAYEACVIMCRKGIEAICTDKGELKGNLAKKLTNLRDKGVLEGTFFHWTEELRLIGNDGAHSHGASISQQDAKDCLNFFDALITFLYHLVHQYEKLKLRRQKLN